MASALTFKNDEMVESFKSLLSRSAFLSTRADAKQNNASQIKKQNKATIESGSMFWDMCVASLKAQGVDRPSILQVFDEMERVARINKNKPFSEQLYPSGKDPKDMTPGELAAVKSNLPMGAQIAFTP